MKKVRLIALSIILLMPVLAFGQLKQDTGVDMAKQLSKPSGLGNIVGLLGLDPNKFSMNHSYSLSFSSFGGESVSQGLYLNTMQYRLSNPITMYLQLGFQHQPITALRNENFAHNQFFVAGAGFEYKPSENFQLQLEFSQQPNGYYSRYNSFYPASLRKNWWEKDDSAEKSDK